jgi:putative phosphoribosyl transferase
MRTAVMARDVAIPAGRETLRGNLSVPDRARGAVLFAHGSGSGRLSPRNSAVARDLQERGLATLLVDLLTEREERDDAHTGHLRFDIGLLAGRLADATTSLTTAPETARLPVGYFGASTGAAAALRASARLGPTVRAVVSRGGRPDLTGPELRAVRAPTLLIVGGDDEPVIELNEQAQRQMRAMTRLEIVPGATHLFEEPGALEHVQRLAIDWFHEHLGPMRG